MPDSQLILRERVLARVCFLIGRTARLFGFRTRRPVFIVGTGRCGTDLLVDILNSHPSLSGFPGEANELWHPKLVPFESTALDVPPIEVNPMRFSNVSIASWPAKHGEMIRDTFTGFNLMSGPSKVFFTKSAMISFLIANILELFPDARILHIYRFGPSVVESYFKKNFSRYSRYRFAEDEYRRHCASYWNACILEIERRKKELSLEAKGQFLEFSYEDLCQNPSGVLADLANFLGVALGGFTYDTSRISSQNYKAADYTSTPNGLALLDLMSSGMKLKGYEATRRDVPRQNRNGRYGASLKEQGAGDAESALSESFVESPTELARGVSRHRPSR